MEHTRRRWPRRRITSQPEVGRRAVKLTRNGQPIVLEVPVTRTERRLLAHMDWLRIGDHTAWKILAYCFRPDSSQDVLTTSAPHAVKPYDKQIHGLTCSPFKQYSFGIFARLDFVVE
jgi:hypothetical protein